MKNKESLKYAAPLRAESPCEGACPVSLKCHSYISLTKEGEFEKAFRAIRQRLPFPRTLGRICDRPCEAYCRRADIDDAIEIRELKRIIADHAHKTEVKYRPTVKRSRKEKVE